ncbi:subtilisin-like protein [Coniophora puteana RWD-64-598 SS2]|uniref:tripeptidyl-peptidase II n=1 Tax=Coniophora puteana (strain RWD-64-598) TaxID=741705 RepID=R7SCT3_CONPW|nr:subtilisin-like protein [Coniophora puteana RWD-64-598 SS2]EIW73981.1 subtilisin-like protein [Coniophora puteana RWD-64-598 SS2]
MKTSIFFSLLAAALVNASALSFRGFPQRVKESTSAPSTGWVKHSAAHPETMLQLQISLTQPRFGELEQHLLEISDPSHERYGVHLSKEEVHELMAPHVDTHGIVAEWLAVHGVDQAEVKHSAAGDWMTVRVPVRLAESMFDTDLHLYKHAESGDSLIRTLEYSLPEILHDHIDLVHPLTMHAPSPRTDMKKRSVNAAHERRSLNLINSRANSTGSIDPSCEYQITPSCLRQLYNIGNYTPSASNGNAIAVTGFTDEWANLVDWDNFLQAQVPSAVGSNFSVVSITGGTNNQTDPGAEANLDVQYAFGLTRPMPATFYTIGEFPGDPPNVNWTFGTGTLDVRFVDFVLNQTNPPQVISTSYGESELSNSLTLSNKVCQNFAALGARGVSVIYSSGDYGVGYSNGTVVPFDPQFPASCPYVTSVGMTYHIPEVAGIDGVYSSSGGFSNIYPRPAYQNQAVQDYLAYLGDEYTGLYNSSGRGYPDVSAQGVNFFIENYGRAQNDTGTSCAAPTFAAIIALLNDARAQAGKGPLGFLNPWLYSTGFAGLNDITEGSNPGCGTNGFNATKGWDPVTGLGTPDFGKLKQLALA